jgi:ABC-type antimicrobial peptide transport system permease subunit
MQYKIITLVLLVLIGSQFASANWEEVLKDDSGSVSSPKKKKLSKREKTVIFTQEEKERLEELNTIFFGNEEGTFNTYVDLPGNYLMTIRTIKQLISSTNKSIDDIIKEVYSLFENEEITKDNKFLQDYLNTIIIPSLLTTLDTHYVSEKIDHKIDRQEHTFDNAQIIQEEREKLDEKQRKKEEEIRKREEIEKKEIEKAKVRKVKQDELNEKLKAKLVEKEAENKNKQKDEKKTFIKNFNDNFEKLKYDLMINNPILKEKLRNINDYENCMNYLYWNN